MLTDAYSTVYAGGGSVCVQACLPDLPVCDCLHIYLRVIACVHARACVCAHLCLSVCVSARARVCVLRVCVCVYVRISV